MRPGLFRHLKVAVDAHRTRNGQFLLTGSQKFTLMKNVSESLAGRADIVELETLSFAEIREALPKTELETAIVRGGFPELYANPDIDSVAFYNSYLATYLERDVRALANVGSLRDFERFLRACALRSANLLNKADLARDVGIAPSTANQWLSMLEASGQVVLLEPWFSNRTKSIVKSPKLYIADTGLLCALLNIRSEEALRQSPAAGAVWETFVFAQLRDRERRAGRTGSLFFWRDRTREVDFVVDAGGRLELFEAKWTELPDARRHGESRLRAQRDGQVTGDRRRSRLPHAEQLSFPERISRLTGDRTRIDQTRIIDGTMKGIALTNSRRMSCAYKAE